MIRAGLILAAATLAACTPVDPEVQREKVMERCAERARQAQGPTGRVTVGANSNDGPFTSVEIGITADALAGRDPFEVYEACVIDGTGAPPTRPLDLNS